MLIKFSELSIPFGRLALGDGEFVVTEELYPDYAQDYDSCQGVAEAMIYDWMNK